MNAQEAEKLLNLDYSISKIDTVSESNNYFIFVVVPITASDKMSHPLRHPVAVDKRNGRAIVFNPMRIPKEELRSIKRIR